MLYDPSKDTSLFLNAEALDIGEKQRDALIKTLLYMEAGHLDHNDFNEDGLKFNMNYWYTDHKCGTVCCIGGTAQMLSGVIGLWDKPPIKDHSSIDNLFFYWGASNITVARAALQLRKYLLTGQCPKHWAIQDTF